MTPKKKDKYRTRNWKEYNRSLVNRGSITFWFDEEAVKNWYSIERTGKPGRPDLYSNAAIRCGLMIKAVFRVALRALQGFIQSIFQLVGLQLICPHYSVFSRRAKDLQIPLRKLLKPGEKLNVIFDSTGIKVFGEGEWKVRKFGYCKRRTWRKVHIAMDADTGQIIVGAMSSGNVKDEEPMLYMMEALEGIPLGDVIGDGAYDTIDCREAIYDRGGRQIIPPPKSAKTQRKTEIPALRERDAAICRIKELGVEGRKRWKEEIGYHRRSRIETCMSRYKKILGDHLSARLEQTQFTEIKIKLDVLNRMAEIGMPQSYKVA
jgi:Transposase DDE domain